MPNDIPLDPGTHNCLLLGISGPSSSGKTTLARLLRDIYPNAFILHEDDFYKTDTQIPTTSSGLQDWDCLDAIDLPALEEALRFIRKNGMAPPEFVSKEDKNSVGEVKVDREVVEKLHWECSRWMFSDVPPVCIIDGFLLYSEAMSHVRDLFDVKLFLRTDYVTAKTRRENRTGYVTLEGFWHDPPGYVDQIVWPNYVKDHAFLFEDGDVEGAFRKDVLQSVGIDAVPQEARQSMTKCVEWAVGVVDEGLGRGIGRG